MTTSIVRNKSSTSEEPQPAQKALLDYNADYQVVICTTCQYAIQPRAITRHLKEIHGIPSRLRRPYLQYVADLPLSEPSQVLDACLDVKKFPLHNLQVMDGFQCLRAGCGHLCVTTKRMQKHWHEQHDESGYYGLDWQPVPLQTFFRGNLLKYFTHPLLSSRPLGFEVSNEEVIKISGDWDISDPLDELDRYLLTHYFNSTYSSLANRHGNGYLWQATIPRFATANLSLRHGILALAALHILFLEDFSMFDSNQLAQAVNHHEYRAKSLFHALILTAPTTPLQSYAIIAFIHLYVLWSFRVFASGQSDDFGELFLISPDRPDLDYMAPWLYYVRHGCQLVCGFWDAVGSGPLATLARSWEIPIMSDDEYSILIAARLLSVVDNGGLGSGMAEETKTEYRQAARDLALAFSATRCLGHELTVWDAIRLWPLTISPDFIQQLNNQSPGALVLLACYCIILDQLNHLWYAKGLSSSLNSKVLARLDGDWVTLAESLRVGIQSIMDDAQN